MKKKAILFVLLFALLFSMPASAAKLTKTQKKVKTTVTNLMKACKKYDISKIRSYCMNGDSIQLFEKKIYSAKFIRKMCKKYFKYTIKNVTVKKNTAKVKVRVKYLDHEELFTTVFEECIKYAIDHPDFTSLEFDEYAYQRMKYNSEKWYVTYSGDDAAVTLTLSLKKTDGKWKLTTFPNKLLNAVHSGYNNTYDHFDWN